MYKISNIDIMANQLGILKDVSEKHEEWLCRVLYSVIGRMILSLLWNYNDEGEVTVRSIRYKTKELISAFERCCPEIKNIYNYEMNSDEFSDIILDSMYNAGFLYHKEGYYRPAMRKDFDFKGVVFHRGIYITKPCFISGLGPYSIVDEYLDCSGYEISVKPEEVLDKLIKSAVWEEYKAKKYEIEYLRVENFKNNKYWCSYISDSSEYSLARTINNIYGMKRYYLIRKVSGIRYITELPQWVSLYRNFTLLSTAILKKNKTLPQITLVQKDTIVHVRVGYRLFPEIENFLMGYSWPLEYKKESINFQRVISKSIYQVVKQTLKNAGYDVIEVKL